ncbi:FAR1 [Cyberlindnera jadinii]|uniref:FAR1 protein n=1 Tax=Cyberlindnera jadinii (strain ATCC 18201 / CBS 1600 / BCRC 20928 / JCM 3617 / NBRC 0987 / NRRL Y-1542) TaxID=983966 RepID=A0A0H5C2T9_CYBJN|nr:FAR1 [Cyberlindnera jadinii]
MRPTANKRQRGVNSTPPSAGYRKSSKISRLFVATTPNGMSKRSRLPEPLRLDSLTPPPTVERQRLSHISPTQQIAKLIDGSSSPVSTLNSPTPMQRPSKNYMKEQCGFCEELMAMRLSTEKVLELSCNHKCHYNCYRVLLNKDDISDLPICSLCGVKSKPVDEAILEEMYSEILINQNTEDFGFEEQLDRITPVVDTVLPQIPPQSGFNSKFLSSAIPMTPLDKMTDQLNSSGFHPTCDCYTSNNPFTPSTLSTPTFVPSWSKQASPSVIADDLLKPQVSIVGEFNKHTINNTVSSYTISHLVNIFTNEIEEEKTSEDFKLRSEIHNKVISIFKERIVDLKGIDLDKLPPLTIFDQFEISIDGESWETVNGFVFTSTLILVHESFSTIVGSVLLKDHFTNSVLQHGDLTLFFSTMTLPELQIRSSNQVVMSKWDDFFAYKLKRNGQIPLIQMSTNNWCLVDDGTLDIPEDARKFNRLTEKGLDLPFNIMKQVLPAPKRLPLNLIVSVTLCNTTPTSNEEYDRDIKHSLRLILSHLGPQDRFGLVVLGRSGEREPDPAASTFYGMTSSSWSGWEEIIEDLESYASGTRCEMSSVVRSLKKLCIVVPELCDEGVIKKLVLIRCADALDVFTPDNFQWIMNKGFSLCDCLVSEHYDKTTDSLVQLIHNEHRYQYQLARYQDFSQFHSKATNMVEHFQKVYTSDFQLTMEIEESSPFAFAQVESHGEMCTPQDPHHLTISLKDLEDGYYHNSRFDIAIDTKKLCESYPLVKNAYHDVSILKWQYKWRGKTVTKELSVTLGISNADNTSSTSPVDRSFTGTRSSSYMDIPLLPPLSSFKDSLYIKKQVELLVIETLTQDNMSVHELISMIFGLIRGCSTNHVMFFKHSRFNKFKNFSMYMDQLLSQLGAIEDETSRKDILYSLKFREEV